MKPSNNIPTPLVIAFTANYFVPAATTILSILNSAQRNEKFHVVVLNNEDLPDRMQQKSVRKSTYQPQLLLSVLKKWKMPDILSSTRCCLIVIC